MHKLNKEKEIVGFYISAHPMDEFKHQYQFLQGALSKKSILEKQVLEIPKEEIKDAEADEEMPDAELISDFDAETAEELSEETTKVIEPKGSFNFLNLDEVEPYKSVVVANHKPDEKPANWRDRQNQQNQGKEYTVAGLITEFTIRDGQRGGEKVAFLTLEDYTGSCSFRLGDRDYMKLKDKLALHRFVILKIKYAVLQDGRCFVNVNDVLELSEAFERFAKSMTVVVPVQDLRQEDLDFFREKLLNEKYKGEHKLSFCIKNPADDSIMELMSIHHRVNINEDLLEIISQLNKFEIFLN